MKKIKIMCQVAPWSATYFTDIYSEIKIEKQIKYISGFKDYDQTNFINLYKEKLKKLKKTNFEIDLKDQETILRCRLLRNLNKVEAKIHVRAMREAIIKIIDDERPNIIIAELIDNYFQDILIQEAQSRSIRCYTFVQNFINGYSRKTIRGELNITREPEKQEVLETIKKILDPSYIPSYVPLEGQIILGQYIKAYLGVHGRWIFFSLKRFLSGEKYNYHYWSCSLSLRKIYAHLIPSPLSTDQHWLSKVYQKRKRSIYIPLQYSPEATIDYWCENIKNVDYEKKVIDYINKLSESFTIIIKEHPSIIGLRHPSFYKKLIELKKVGKIIICPTYTQSKRCIENTDAIFIFTGSAGFEAALKGKSVLTAEFPYFKKGRFFKNIDLNTGLTEIIDFIDRNEKKYITHDEQYEMVANLLSGLIKIPLYLDGSYDKNNKSHKFNSMTLGEWISEDILKYTNV